MTKPRQHPQQTAEEKAEEVAWVRDIMGAPAQAHDAPHEHHRRPASEVEAPADARQ